MTARRHFIVLDGMRGIAALAVMGLHTARCFHLWAPPHAHLAVDFFFCLSGFVIAHAYDGAFAEGRIDLPAFARRRVVRLYPMVLAGALLGGLALLFSATHSDPKPLWLVGVLTATNAVLAPGGIPFGLMAFPADAPLWSLFFEGVANAGYGALGGRVFSPRVAAILLSASACAITVAAALAHGVQDLGFQAPYWFVGGMVRVTYPFLAGVLISRARLIERMPAVPEFVVAGALAVVLLSPAAGPAWVYDVATILVAVPAMLVLGAAAAPTPATTRVWKLLGDISYPLYAIHLPVIYLAQKFLHHGVHLHSEKLEAVIAMSAALAASWLALKVYDIPVRTWLNGRERALRAVATA